MRAEESAIRMFRSADSALRQNQTCIEGEVLTCIDTRHLLLNQTCIEGRGSLALMHVTFLLNQTCIEGEGLTCTGARHLLLNHPCIEGEGSLHWCTFLLLS